MVVYLVLTCLSNLLRRERRKRDKGKETQVKHKACFGVVAHSYIHIMWAEEGQSWL